jgi:carbon-monoxide dehydrogenase medium subunit
MSSWNHYLLPHTLAEALRALAAEGGQARPIAGGTDLLLDIGQGRQPPIDTLVDVSDVAEMNLLELRGESLFIGAAVPLSRLVVSPLLHSHARALIEACGLIGGPQVRNVATLGGNVAHALPAADGTIALLALDAQAEIASLAASRLAPLSTLFAGAGQSTLQVGKEIIVGFHLPLSKPGQESAFQRVMRPQGVALPILNLAAWIHRAADRILDVRLAIGPGGPTPLRLSGAEQILRGQVFRPEIIAAAVRAMQNQARFRSSPGRATVDYRRSLAETLTQEVLQIAWERAAGAPLS